MGATGEAGAAPARRPPRPVRFAQIAGAAAAAIGVVVLTGWWLGVAALTTLVAGWPAMKPASALMCILCGVALLVAAPPDRPRWARVTAGACAATAGTLALFTLLEHAFGVRLGLDRLLVGQSLPPPDPRTAASLVLVSAALLSIDRVTPGGRSPAQILGLAAAALPLLTLLSYAFGLPQLHGGPWPTIPRGPSFPAAAALVLLGAGVFAARPAASPLSELLSEHAGGVMSRRLVLGLLALVPAALLVVAGRRLGWYGGSIAGALFAFLVLVERAVQIFVPAGRLNQRDRNQKATQVLLRQSEQRVRDLFGLAPDGIFVADLSGRYIDANAAACRLLDLSRDEILGKSIVDLIPAHEVERLWREKQTLLAGESVLSHWTLRRRDGSYVPVEVSAAILPDGRWQGFVRDVTERQRAQAAIEEARETDRRLRTELERVTRAAMSVSQAVAELPDPDISAPLRTVALEAQALTDARYVAVGLGGDPDEPFQQWIALGSSGEVVEIGPPAAGRSPQQQPDMRTLLRVPIRYRGRQVGNLFLAEKRDATEFSVQDLRMVGMLAARAAVSIETAKLYAGEAAQRARLRNIIDQMPEAVIIIDEKGQLAAVNRAGQALTRGDTAGRDPWGNPVLFDVRQADGSPLPFRELPLVRALEHGEVIAGQELALRLGDGRLVPILANAGPIRDDAGRASGAVVVVRDITPLKELERLREEWASIIAHDLRQPVHAISIAVELLARRRQGEVSEQEERLLGRVRSGAIRLRRMIDDLLDVSRIEARHLSLAPRSVDLTALVDTVAESMREQLGGHEIRVVAPPGQYVWIDPDRVQQVLTNLLSNAAKYGYPGTEIRLEVAVRDDMVEVAVANWGRGIASDELPLLFRRFGRTRQARREGSTPGIGLGLYISKGLVEAHGGRMWVESEPGGLTTFRFVVPRAPREAQAPADPGSPAAPP